MLYLAIALLFWTLIGAPGVFLVARMEEWERNKILDGRLNIFLIACGPLGWVLLLAAVWIGAWKWVFKYIRRWLIPDEDKTKSPGS